MRKNNFVLGEVKPSVDGEKEGNKIRHGDHESTPGTKTLSIFPSVAAFA